MKQIRTYTRATPGVDMRSGLPHAPRPPKRGKGKGQRPGRPGNTGRGRS